VQCKDTDIKKT